MNEDLDQLYKVICQHRLKLNIKKTKLTTNRNVNRESIQIAINEETIVAEKEVKYLGIVLDENFNCKRLGKKIGVQIEVVK